MTTPTEPRPAADERAVPPERREMRPGVLLLLALAAVTLAYSNAFSGPFVWDDHSLIEEQESDHHADNAGPVHEVAAHD